MSGKKQHYIPQVLLRCFSSDPERKSPPIVVYSRVRGCYRTNTLDAAAEREFYSPLQSEGNSLDDHITTYENELAQQLTSVSAGGGSVDANIAAAIIVHLTIRNDHTRKMLREFGTRMMGALDSMLQDRDFVELKMGFNRAHADSLAKQQVRKELNERLPNLTRQQRRKWERQLLPKVEKEFGAVYEKNKSKMSEMLRVLSHNVGRQIKGSHNKSLAGSLVPEKRVATLSRMRWQLVQGEFLLPDCVAIAITKTTGTPYLLTNDDELQNVFMPISKNAGLYGSLAEEPVPPPMQLCALAAASSADFFIAPLVDEKLKALIKSIGTGVSEQIDSLITEAAAKLRSNQ